MAKFTGELGPIHIEKRDRKWKFHGDVSTLEAHNLHQWRENEQQFLDDVSSYLLARESLSSQCRSQHQFVNVAHRLHDHAAAQPEQIAVAAPQGRDARGKYRYRTITYAELDALSTRLACGMLRQGIAPGERIALLVPPSIEFIVCVFALFKAGVVSILIDPGMGRRNMIRCLSEAEPVGFVGVPLAQIARLLFRRRFPQARHFVTVGKKLGWPGTTYRRLIESDDRQDELPHTYRDDPAAIIFTTGSTGPAKGVLYRHGNFDAQVEQIQQRFGIAPGGVDLAGFPLFGLFNSGMGLTTVIPDMDPTRPAKVNPRNVLDHVNDWNVTQSFGSPALWNRVGRYCEAHGERLATLRNVYSAGAPVPGHVLRRIKGAIHPQGEVHTPYGATEALPVAAIGAGEVLGGTQAATDAGGGVCVGRRFSGITWRVIEISDGPLPTIDVTRPLPQGEIGELIVQGPVVTSEYATRREANAGAKIADGSTFWHRMGDVGYLDDEDRFWFCGRLGHRVTTAAGTMFTIPCEAIINTHPAVYRSALVGVGSPGRQRPVMVIEREPASGGELSDDGTLLNEVGQLAAEHAPTRGIEHFFLHPGLPVDIRHNAKIFREKLVPYAESQLKHRRT